MAHISLPEGYPGITGPMKAYPAAAAKLNGLAQEILRGTSSLSVAERELIATYVSSGNQCRFCCSTHAATARCLLGPEAATMDEVLKNPATDRIDARLRSLLTIANKVRQDGRQVTAEDVAEARRHGADDRAIHDTVLIAAAFCMFNRYVDGLATWAPEDPAAYDMIGARLASSGYLNSID